MSCKQYHIRKKTCLFTKNTLNRIRPCPFLDDLIGIGSTVQNKTYVKIILCVKV